MVTIPGGMRVLFPTVILFNGIDDGGGMRSVTMTAPNAITTMRITLCYANGNGQSPG